MDTLTRILVTKIESLEWEIKQDKKMLDALDLKIDELTKQLVEMAANVGKVCQCGGDCENSGEYMAPGLDLI